MRNWLFDSDSPLIRGLSRFYDLLLLAVLTGICSIPIITAGAAVTAMYDVMIRMALEKENGIIKSYFRAFGKNFGKSTLIWLICIVGIAFVVANYYFLSQELTGIPEALRTIITVIVFMVTIIFSFVLIYVFPLQARYENKVGATIKNALFISVAQFPRSIALFFMHGVVVVLAVIAPGVIPLLMLVEFSLVSYYTAKNMVKVFAAFGDEEAKRGKRGVIDDEDMISEEDDDSDEICEGENTDSEKVSVNKEFEEVLEENTDEKSEDARQE